MKKICNLIIIIVLILVCNGCKENNNLDLENLYEKNFELASHHFLGWGAYKYELILFEPENANQFETDHFSSYFSYGVEKLLYVRYELEAMPTYVLAIQYKTVKQANDAYTDNKPRFIKNKNILSYNTTAGYMLLYGEYKEIDGYWLSPDGDALLFDIQGLERVDMVIPKGVKIIPAVSLFSPAVKTIKCNSELEILYSGAFAFLPALEKIELNDGLKEIWGDCFIYHNLDYVVIPESVEKIEAKAFKNVAIYCNVEKKPWGWHKDFALDNCDVYWKGSWEYVDGIPQPIVNEVE